MALPLGPLGRRVKGKRPFLAAFASQTAARAPVPYG